MPTLTTSEQVIAKNESGVIHTYLKAWYSNQSGNSCVVHAKLTVINTGATYTGTNKKYAVTAWQSDPNYQVHDWPYTPLNTNEEVTVAEATWSYGSGDLISAQALFWSYVYGSADIGMDRYIGGNWYVPTFATAPTGLAVSNIVSGQEGFTADVSITGWGGAGDASSRYRELQVWTYSQSGLVEPRRYQAEHGNTLSSNITVTNSSNGTLTIVPNTKYVIGAYATNGTYNTGSQRMNVATTLPPTPALSLTDVTQGAVSFTYSVPNQGGEYDMVVKYQLDSGPSVTLTTLTGSGTKSGSFSFTMLQPGTSHTITLSLATTAGESVSNTVSFETLAACLYGSANNYSKRIRKLYGPIPAVTTTYTVTDISNNIDFRDFAFMNKYKTVYGNITKEPTEFRIGYGTGNQNQGRLYFSDNTYSPLFEWTPNNYNNEGQPWGFEPGFTPVEGQVSFIPNTCSTKEIIKVYGSQNGVTKRIY